MPSRRDIFVNKHFYHIYNKTIDRIPIFQTERLAQHFLDLMYYYRSSKITMRYSHFAQLSHVIKRYKEYELTLKKYFLIDIVTFCIMPNHYHLLLMQKLDNGIFTFVSNILNAITRYYNILNKRKGPIFLPQFKSRMIVNQEQFIHVSRYIHLNPYSSGIVKNIDELSTYQLSSLKHYLNQNIKQNFCNPTPVLSCFKNSVDKYKQFILANADHQKMLDQIKYVEKWIS